jgi:hypothetical protein
MAHTIMKTMVYGIIGVFVAIVIILFLWPISEDIETNPTVSIQEMPAFGIQVIKITDEPNNLAHLNCTINGFEAKQPDGEWIKIDTWNGGISFDLLRFQRPTIIADASKLVPGNYSMIRFQIIGDLEYTNATLDEGEIIGVDVPTEKICVAVPTFEITPGMETLLIDLLIEPTGSLANYVIQMEHHLTLMMMKIQIKIQLDAGEAYAITD